MLLEIHHSLTKPLTISRKSLFFLFYKSIYFVYLFIIPMYRILQFEKELVPQYIFSLVSQNRKDPDMCDTILLSFH